jgi:hypothetical protein
MLWIKYHIVLKMLELFLHDIDRRPKHVTENTVSLYISYTCKFFVSKLSYIPTHGMNNVILPSNWLCKVTINLGIAYNDIISYRASYDGFCRPLHQGLVPTTLSFRSAWQWPSYPHTPMGRSSATPQYSMCRLDWVTADTELTACFICISKIR